MIVTMLMVIVFMPVIVVIVFIMLVTSMRVVAHDDLFIARIMVILTSLLKTVSGTRALSRVVSSKEDGKLRNEGVKREAPWSESS